MKTAAAVTAEKLRGGFYSPPTLVNRCLDRIAELMQGKRDLAVLEPSAGDGAFLRGLSDHSLAPSVAKVLAIEINQQAATLCRAALRDLPAAGRVIQGSALSWATNTTEQFDVTDQANAATRDQVKTGHPRSTVMVMSAGLLGQVLR